MREILLSLSIGFSVTFLFGLVLYPLLKKMKLRQTILSYVTEHKQKSGTPTMGGIMFILGIIAAYLIINGFDHIYALIALAMLLSYGLVGFLDDFIKVRFSRNLGLRAYQKVIFQLFISCIIGAFMYSSGNTILRVPFTDMEIDMSFWIVPITVLVIIACTNSVNLTDGLDGLSGGVSLVYMVAFLIMLYLTAGYLHESGMIVAEEFSSLSILCAVAIGSILAFLGFNSYPAKIFMGDTGSMGLGGLCASVGIFSGFTLFIPIIGIMFVISTLSVIIQVASFKLRKKRVFKMSPFHHHLQQSGYSETKISTFYMIITILVSSLTIALTF